MTLTIDMGVQETPKLCSTENRDELAQILQAVQHAADRDLKILSAYKKSFDLWLHHAGDYERLSEGEWQVFCAINDAFAESLRRHIEAASVTLPAEVVDVLPALRDLPLEELKARAEGDEDRLFREFYVTSADYESDDSDVEDATDVPLSRTRFARQKRGGRRRPTRRTYRGFDPSALWVRERMERIEAGFGVAYGEVKESKTPLKLPSKKKTASKNAPLVVETSPPFTSEGLAPNLEKLIALRREHDDDLKSLKEANERLEEWVRQQIRREYERDNPTLFKDDWPAELERQKDRLVTWMTSPDNHTEDLPSLKTELKSREDAKKRAGTNAAAWIGAMKDYFENHVRGARSWGRLADRNATIYYPPSTWTAEVKAELKAVNDALKTRRPIPPNRFLVAQYRGIAYNTNVFKAAARRRSRESVELKLPVYCSAVFETVGISPADYYAGGFTGNEKVNQSLAEAAQKLRSALLAKRRSGPITFTEASRAIYRGEAKPQANAESGSAKSASSAKKDPYSHKLSWSTSGEFTFSSTAFALQNFYTINYKGFFEQMQLHLSSSLPASTQDSPSLVDSGATASDPGFRLLFEGLTNPKNPMVSTGNTPRHSLRYAYSRKYYSNTDKPHKLIPDWSPEDGRTRHPYSGKVYISLHEPSDYDWDTGALDVVGLARKQELDVPSDILGEREAAFPAMIPENRVIAEHIARYPSFAGTYKIAYLEKYGLTKAEWETFQALNSLAVNDTHRDKLLDAVSEWLVRFHEARLVELARRLAENDGGKILVYVGDDGLLVEGADDPLHLKVDAPRGASKTEPEHTTLDSGLNGRDTEERDHPPVQPEAPRDPLPLVGILNRYGNECYMNSVLQLLLVLRPETNYERPEGARSERSFARAVLRFLDQLRKDVAEHTCVEDGVACYTRESTWELRQILTGLRVCDTVYSQEDAGAALAAILNTFDHHGLEFDPASKTLAENRPHFLERRPSQFHLLFRITTHYDPDAPSQGEPVNDPIELDNDFKSVRYDTGIMLQLSFPPVPGENVSYDDLLGYFRNHECATDEAVAAKCHRAGQYYPAARLLRVETEIEAGSPRLIMLSRYIYRKASSTLPAVPVRIDSRVDMPDQIEGKQLLGVIRHFGTSPKAGHYVAAVRAKGGWYLANDQIVQKLSAQQTQDLISDGYIYYYG